MKVQTLAISAQSCQTTCQFIYKLSQKNHQNGKLSKVHLNLIIQIICIGAFTICLYTC